MGRLMCHVRFIRVGLALALVATLAAPIPAFADRGGHGDDERDDDHGRHTQDIDCPGHQTLIRIDEVVCPATKHRPLIVRKRACCQNKSGQVHCDHFEHCPHESPS